MGAYCSHFFDERKVYLFALELVFLCEKYNYQ